MIVTVNGEPHELPTGTTVSSVIELLAGVRDGRGLAVALAGEVVPRGAWSRTPVHDGAVIEVVAAVQGG